LAAIRTVSLALAFRIRSQDASGANLAHHLLDVGSFPQDAVMSFRQCLTDERVSSLQLRDAIVVRPETLVRAAIAAMRHHSLGCVVIVDENQVAEGIFTERSVLDVLMQHACLDDRPVSDFADRNFVSVKLSEPIWRVWEAVQLAAARFVCVTNDAGKLIGLTGQRGISEYVADHFSQQVTVQRLGSKPWMQQREGA
jgi:CBS domain-containing protein